MTTDELKSLAIRAGFAEAALDAGFLAKLERLAGLVAEAEREADAKVCEETYTEGAWGDVCAAAIRERSNG